MVSPRASLSFAVELRSVCKREKTGNIIASRNERRARTRTSMDVAACASSANFGEDGLFDLGVRERD